MRSPHTSTAARMATAVFVGGLIALTSAAPALAIDEVNIDHVETVDGTTSLVLAVDGIPGGGGVDPTSIQVEVDGRAVDAVGQGHRGR